MERAAAPAAAAEEPAFEVAVARAGMLAEEFCVHLLERYLRIGRVITAPVTEPSLQLLSAAAGRRLLVFGGYYRENLPSLLREAATVTCVVQDEEEEDVEAPAGSASKHSDAIRACPCDWTLRYLRAHDRAYPTTYERTATYLDAYQYRWPSEDALDFISGLSCWSGTAKPVDAALALRTSDEIDACLSIGRRKRNDNLNLARERLSRAVEWTLPNQTTPAGRPLVALVAPGDSNLVETSMLLASESASGVGILVRHDYRLRRTYLSICAVPRSGVSASAIARALVGGGGCKYTAGGSAPGLWFLHEQGPPTA